MGFLTKLGDIGKGIISGGAAIGIPGFGAADTAISLSERARGVGRFREPQTQARSLPSPPPSMGGGGRRMRQPKLVPKSIARRTNGNGNGAPFPGGMIEGFPDPLDFANYGVEAFRRMTGGNGNGNGNGQFTSDLQSLIGPNRVVVEPGQKVIHKAPPGFVIVDMPDGSGKKAVRKKIARQLGLWKPRKKPPISASEWGKLKAADRVKKKAKKIAQTADFKCTKK